MNIHSTSQSLALSLHDLDTLCQYYLNVLYYNVEKRPASNKNVCESYGEILYAGVDKLLSIIQLTNNDVFIDYGAGLGKIVVQVFLKSLVKEAYGIEIVPELHQQAINVAQRLHHDLPEFFNNERKLKFLYGDFLETPIPQATVALVCSTCFTQSLLNDLGTILEHSPNLHTVISMRPIGTLQRLAFNKSISLECSWNTTLCYIYSNK